MGASIFDNPLVQSAALPLTVTLIACGLIRLAGGRSRGPLLAGAAVSIGLLAAYAAISGFPVFPPRASSQKLFYLMMAGVVVGVVIDLTRPGPGVSRTAILAALGLGIAWLTWPRLRSAEPAAVLTVTLLWMAAGILLVRLHGIRDRGVDGAVLVLAAALGLAAIAFLGRTASYAQLGAALAAATGGFILWNWPVVRFPFGAAAVLGAGGACMGMAANILFYTKASPIAMLCLIPVFFADAVAERLPLPRALAGQTLRPLVLLAVASIPLGAAVAIGALKTG